MRMRTHRWRAGITAAILTTAAASAWAFTAGAADAATATHAGSVTTTHPGMHSVSAHGHTLLGTGPHTEIGRSHIKNTEYSTNWSGYAADSTTYNSVTASWTQPTATCSSSSTDEYSAFWVGLDGYSSSTVEQTGTESDCISGTAYYGAWYEAYPAASNDYSDTVKAGDSFTATVTASGTSFDLVLTDSTEGWTESTTVSVSSAEKSSAEVIAEAPSDDSGVLPLADFGTVDFTGATANSTAFASLSPIQIDMETSSGTLEASTSSISSESFSVTWESSGSSSSSGGSGGPGGGGGGGGGGR